MKAAHSFRPFLNGHRNLPLTFCLLRAGEDESSTVVQVDFLFHVVARDATSHPVSYPLICLVIHRFLQQFHCWVARVRHLCCSFPRPLPFLVEHFGFDDLECRKPRRPGAYASPWSRDDVPCTALRCLLSTDLCRPLPRQLSISRVHMQARVDGKAIMYPSRICTATANV